ncbi:MAG: GNAT family N-acetyltransferase [Gemmatimonadales bacterium]|nr:MAG: GNAT family N-acetyltransferase [Gemmatimonadales bacterium]
MQIRPATIGDLDALVPLFDGYRQFYEQAPDPALAREFLGERLTLGDTTILLAEIDGAAAGFVHLFPIFSSTVCRRLWLLNDLFVAADARHLGVGRGLLDAARAFAESTGACGLELATAHSNLPAQRLYEAIGWRVDEVFRRYELPLPQPPTRNR